MLLCELPKKPFHRLPFLNAGAGRRQAAYPELLPFYRSTIEGLPAGTPPFLLTADLQGRTDYGDSDGTLLGCCISEQLIEIEETQGLPPVESCLVLLAGDFYTLPNAAKRGGTGPVDAVWDAMEVHYLDVRGVTGNHDSFRHKPRELLDGHCAHFDNLRIGGVSGIIGSTLKPMRRCPDEFAHFLAQALSEDPEILILHSPPHVNEANPGSIAVTEMLDDFNFEGLLVCAHMPWHDRNQRVGRFTCVNAHEGVVILEAS
jgi:hypothetical protein